MNSSIRVTIHGREYTLLSQGSKEQAERVVRFVEEKLTETAAGKSVDTRDLTVLTLLNIAGQYLQLVEGGQKQQVENDFRLKRVVEKLERALEINSGC